ncbi:hypothetical protein ABK040_000527 [Willaertia magna]
MNDIQQKIARQIERQEHQQANSNQQPATKKRKQQSNNENTSEKQKGSNSDNNQQQEGLLPGYTYNYGTIDRSNKVKDRRAASLQITAEQIIHEAYERKEPSLNSSALQKSLEIKDLEELQEYQLRMRKQHEDAIRKSKYFIGNYLKYAKFEESQKQYERVRSIFERALDVNYKDTLVWLRYAEFEMRNKFINHARNIWDRAVTLLPRVDQLWYKYIYMEEMLGNVKNARNIYNRWMEWQPDEKCFKSFLHFELRHKNLNNCKVILEKLIRIYPNIDNWLYYIKFEKKYLGNDIDKVRILYERAVTLFDLEILIKSNSFTKSQLNQVIDLYLKFATFEIENQEKERAITIFKYLLDKVPNKEYGEYLFEKFLALQKTFGNVHGIEQLIFKRKKIQFEKEIKENPSQYDTWLSYLYMVMEYYKNNQQQQLNNDKEEINTMMANDHFVVQLDDVRELFERAVSCVPEIKEKKYFKRYIYIWINYAIFEELIAKNNYRARQVYTSCLQLFLSLSQELQQQQMIGNIQFSKIWTLFSQFEIRNHNIDSARKILDTALKILNKKDKIFKEYIKIEIILGNISKVRELFQELLESNPQQVENWKHFAELEVHLNETERAISIFELAINQPYLDQPEVIWRSYIDLEIKLKHFDKVRKLFLRLLEKTKHLKVWLSYISFERNLLTEMANNFTNNEEDEEKKKKNINEQIDKIRSLFEDATNYFKIGKFNNQNEDLENLNEMELVNRREQRAKLLIEWISFEESLQNEIHFLKLKNILNLNNKEMIEQLKSKKPTKIRKKRRITNQDGTPGGWEEYIDYIFKDEEDEKNKKGANLKILEKALQWKKLMEQKKK